MSAVFDIRWPTQYHGLIPLQHQYSLLAALSRIVPDVHHNRRVGIHSIRGIHDSPGWLRLTPRSALMIRSPLELIPKLIALSGTRIELAGCSLRLGVPSLRSLVASPILFCPTVTIKGFMECDDFRKAVIRQLDNLGVRQSISIAVGSRRVLQIKSATIVGFGLHLGNLEAEESVLIQSAGIGGRRHLGCGIFLPTKSQFSSGS